MFQLKNMVLDLECKRRYADKKKNIACFGVIYKTSTICYVGHKFYGSCYKNMVLDLNAYNDMGIDEV